jgi:SAM-dependent methyltransferase
MNDSFDGCSRTYRDEVQRSIDFIGQDVDFFTEVKARYLLELCRRHLGPTDRLSVLDIGCGPGTTDRYLKGKFASLDGIDVSEPLIGEAARVNPWARYRSYEGGRLPFPDGRFAVAFAISVVHHVPHAGQAAFAREMARVVSPGGLAVVFEHNPFNPLSRLAVARCKLDKGTVLCSKRRVEALFTRNGLAIAEARYIVFFPWRHQLLEDIDRSLGWLPLGAQYLVAARPH